MRGPLCANVDENDGDHEVSLQLPDTKCAGGPSDATARGLLHDPDQITASVAAPERAMCRGLPEPEPASVWPCAEDWRVRAACLPRAARDWLFRDVWPDAGPWRRSSARCSRPDSSPPARCGG